MMLYFCADVTEPLLVEVDQIYHLACPASPIFYKYNPVKVCMCISLSFPFLYIFSSPPSLSSESSSVKFF
jgi:hypothetical protein